MARYAFPTTQSHSPYHGYQQHAMYPPSTPSSHSAYYGTPVRRRNSFNGHTTPHHYTTPNTAYYTSSPYGHNAPTHLAVPGTSSSHRSRSSQSRHHGHGYGTSHGTYTPSAGSLYADHRSSHRYPSSSHSHYSYHSHHSHAHSPASHHPTRQRTTSIGDRVRRFFGLDPPHHHSTSTSYGDGRRRRHNSFSGYRDDNKLHRTHTTRSGPWFFGSTDNKRYVDEHGREVDQYGRVIHRF
ncbi:hypothetical protein ID866_1744 [Astraeus odoratus]|nr:hypothetical protein ID866_1744 [Astraeus odoratus]